MHIDSLQHMLDAVLVSRRAAYAADVSLSSFDTQRQRDEPQDKGE